MLLGILIVLAALLLMIFMPKAVTDNLYNGQIQMGEQGVLCQYGQAHFVTTGATLVIPTKFRQIRAILITPMATPASDEIIYAPANADGSSLIVDGSGTITITRTGASKTSGLGFYYWIIGN